MTDKEQIIIHEIDVSKCKYHNNGWCELPESTDDARNKPCGDMTLFDCYYKQLVNKTQEFEQLEEKYEALKLENEEGYEIVAELKHECKEQEDKIKKLRKNLALEIESTDRYRKALEEIEELIVPVANKNPVYNCWELLNKCDKCKSKKDCGAQSPYYVAKQILDIINKAKGEGNE